MAEMENRKSSVSEPAIHEEDELGKDANRTQATRSPKKKKVRKHRVQKGVNLGKVEEETDDESERKCLSSRERKQQPPAGVDIEDIPTMNYVSDDKKPPVVLPGSDPEEEVHEEEEKDMEEEEEEIEEEDPCMTQEEKQAMYKAASLGDIDQLENCLDKPHSDINMIWFQENLLVAALKFEQEEMAEFLIDNGVNYNFKTVVINILDERTRKMEWYDCSCRQLAFDKGLHDIVELVDYLNGDLYKFIKPKPRIPRYRRPKPPTPIPSRGESENDASSEASKDRSDDESDGRQKRKKKKKRKDSKEEDGERQKVDKEKKETKGQKFEKDVLMKLEVADLDGDSGHHSESDGRRGTDVEDGSRSRTSSSKGRTGSRIGSSRRTSASGRNISASGRNTSASGRNTSATDRSPSPPVVRSETFLKKFVFIGLNCPSDEGYGSLSPKSSPVSMESRRKGVPITIPPRGTKSSLGMRQASLIRKSRAEQRDDLPVNPRKVKTPGSYENESTRWHCRVDKDFDKTVNQPKSDTVPNKKTENVPKRIDANYMKMTTSAFTKRKLEPNFRKSYSSLEFVSDKIVRPKIGLGNRKVVYTRQTVSFTDLNPKAKGKGLPTTRSHRTNKWTTQIDSPELHRAVTRVF